MRIGIDARTILNPEKGEAIGVGHYTYQLIRHLLKLDKENEYVLFFDFRVREKDIKKFTQANVKIKFYPFSDYKKYLPGAYSEILGTATLQKEKLDILHSTSPLSRIPASYRGKTVVTFYDMGMYKSPESFSAIRMAKNKAIYKLMANKADKVIVVSNSIREDLKKILSVAEKKISVVYSGLDKRFFDAQEGNNQKVLEKFGIKKKYVLFLGTLEPIKNIAGLLKSFALFKEKYCKTNKNFDYQLVIAGKRGWLSQSYPQMAKDLGIAKDIVFTGYIIGDELVPLFKQADFFIMPSLYEGFGTTILEAFAVGTPSIISNVASAPEIIGDAAILVNPVDTEGIAKSMMDLASSEELKKTLREKGLSRARNFDWEKCARETLEIYKSLK
jgi:glycosyltransferase involved in cell wall biosynthesis